jgi:hypothetical protein
VFPSLVATLSIDGKELGEIRTQSEEKDPARGVLRLEDRGITSRPPLHHVLNSEGLGRGAYWCIIAN